MNTQESSSRFDEEIPVVLSEAAQAALDRLNQIRADVAKHLSDQSHNGVLDKPGCHGCPTLKMSLRISEDLFYRERDKCARQQVAQLEVS